MGAAYLIAILVLSFAALKAPAMAESSPPLVLGDTMKLYDVVRASDVLDDPSGNLEITDVARSVSFSRRANATAPPDGAIRWYRFRLNVTNSTTLPWFLITDTRCDDADAYFPISDGSFKHRAFGYRTPYAYRDVWGFRPAIKLGLPQAKTIFVRLSCGHISPTLSISNEIRSRWFYFEAGTHPLAALVVVGVLAFGLALITGSRSYALVGLASVLFATHWFWLWHFAQWFPFVSPPPFVYPELFTTVGFFIVQWLFYERFLDVGKSSQRASSILAGSLVATVTAYVLIFVLPSSWTSSIVAVVAPEIVFYTVVVVIATRAALAGNGSAWFVAAGVSLLIVTSLVSNAAFGSRLPLVLHWAWIYGVLVDAMLFVLGVGYRLRETSLAYARILREHDESQQRLVTSQQRHIAEVEASRASFARFVPSEFLRHLEKDRIEDVALGDHVECSLAVLFSDIRGFTSLAECLPSEQTFALLNDHLARVGPLVRKHGGFVDKYVGDGMFALFPRHPCDALDAAIALQEETRRFNEERARKSLQPIAIGIGVNYGRMMLGTIGEPERMDTTVIADAVNVASRLEGLTKTYGVSIVVSGGLVRALDEPHTYGLRPLGDVVLRGHERPESPFELFDGDAYDVVLHKRRTLASFIGAVDAYRGGAYSISRDMFAGIVDTNPLDRAAAYLRDRSAVMGKSIASDSEC